MTRPADDAAVIREIIAAATSTLAEPSARIELRTDVDVVLPDQLARRGPGPGRLVRLAVWAWDRVAPEADAAPPRDVPTRDVAEGFLEPAVGRYQLDFGSYAAMGAGGSYFGGRPGIALQPRHRQRRPPAGLNEPLKVLRALREATGARHLSDEAIRGTACRVIAVTAGSAELTVWIDDQHVRRIRSKEHASRRDTSLSVIKTLELWDFGVPVDSLDWSRLPSIRTP
jgi:hypothetical protein